MSAPSYAELYNALYGGKDYAGEVDTVLSLAERGVTTVLDVGCGTGRHALAFSARGVDVCGVDTDAAMLAVARGAQPTGSGTLTWYDTLDATPHSVFDAAVSLFHVVNYVTERNALTRFFGDIAQRLPSGSPFFFDAWNGIAALRDPPRVKESSARWHDRHLRVITTPTLDAWRQRVQLDVEIHVASSATPAQFTIVRKRYDHRLWTPQELIECLAEVGFRTCGVSTWAAPRQSARVEDWKLLFHTERA